MSNEIEYIFTSNRLGFRNWNKDDLPLFERLNSNPTVMRYFPKVLSDKASAKLMTKFTNHFEENGFTYYAVDMLSNSKFIGFIGLQHQSYSAPFTPAIDIGWRLLPNAWNKGYATEGALSCIAYAFNELKLSKLVSVCPKSNKTSERVMQKAGMVKQGEFNHPKLTNYPNLQKCVWYQLLNPAGTF